MHLILIVTLFKKKHSQKVIESIQNRFEKKNHQIEMLSIDLKSDTIQIVESVKNKNIFQVMFLHDSSISEEDLKIKFKPFFDHYSGLKPLYPNLIMFTFKETVNKLSMQPRSLPFKCEGMDVKKFLSIYKGKQ